MTRLISKIVLVIINTMRTKIICISGFILLTTLYGFSQVFPWNGYTASQTSFTPYTYVTGGMTAIVTPNVPGSAACPQYLGSKVSNKFFCNPSVPNNSNSYSPRYITPSGSGDYNMAGLLLAVEWPTLTCSIDVDITFNPPVCAPVYFDIYDINTDGGALPFSDVVVVSGKTSSGTTVFPTATGMAGGNTYNSATGTVSNSWPTFTGGNALSTVRFTFATGNISSIKITYKSNSTITNNGSGCSNNNNGTDPYYQYIVISSINAGTPTASITSTATTCGSSTVTLNGTTSISSPVYSWTGPGGSTITSPSAPSTSVTGAGTYTLTVTSSNGCSATATYTLSTGGTPPDLTTGPGKTIGCGTNPTISASSTTPGVTYLWSGPGIVSGSNTSSPVVNAPGTYTVTVTDGGGCSKTGTVSVTTNITYPDLTTGGPVSLTCTKTNAVVSASSTTPGATFKWAGFGITFGGSTANATVIFAGTYTVTVTDPASGCTKTGTVTVTNNTTVPNLTMGSPLTLGCNSTSGIISANSTTAGVTYSWSGPGIVSGGTTSTPTVNAAGTYSVTVADPVNGCKKTATITVNSSATPPDVSIANPGQLTCSSTSVTLTGNSTTAGVTYQWTGGPATANYIVNAAGTYTLTVTDPANGCTSTSTATVITNGSLPTVTASASGSLSCSSNNVVLTATSPGSQLVWNGGSLVNAPNPSAVSAAGTYTVTATSTGGCTNSSIVTVTGNTTPPTINSIAPNAVLCKGNATGSATVNATSAGILNYLWNTTAATQTIINVAAGIYTVTITDLSSGCTVSGSVTITEPANGISNTVNSIRSNCGQSNGNASITASGGTAPYTYSWSNGATAQTISGIPAAAYIITISDASGCTRSDVATITDIPAPDINSLTGTNLLCKGYSNGSAVVSASGGSGTLTYNWSVTGGSGVTGITGLSSGTYIITVSDAAGCKAVSTVTITEPASITTVMSSTNASCGPPNGTAGVIASGGTGLLTYNWSNSATGQTLTGLAPGSYTLTINDANGCTTTSSVTVGSNSALPDISILTPGQLSCNNSSVSLIGSSITPGVTYQWTGGPTSANYIVNTAGVYTLTVTNSSTGCSSTLTVTVSNSAGVPTVSIATPGQLTCINSSITLTGSSTTPGVNYQWTNGPSTAGNSVNTTGTYTLIVTDPANGCTSSTTVTVSSNTVVPDAAILPPGQITCGTPSVTLTGTSTTSGATFQWAGGPATSSYIVSATGIYTLMVTDPANGCTTSTTATVSSTGSIPVASVSSLTNILCNGGNDGSAAITVNGGTSPYTYLWSNNQSNAGVVNVAAGNYTVTITDATGCSTVSTVNLTEPSPLLVSTSSRNASCINNSGSVTATVTGGTPGYTYNWSTGTISMTNSLTDSINNIATGIYAVTITDANGCSSVSTSTVISTNFTVSTNIPAQQTIYEGTGVNIVLSGGVSYTWLPASGLSCTNCSSVTAKPAVTTTYTITAMDGYGCTAVVMITITVKAPCTDDANDIFIANVFSPNNDGNNDMLYVQGNGLVNLYWAIYDRWGNIMFEGFDQTHGWDGTKKGNPVESGTYVYYLKATCVKTNSEVRLKGNVTVLR